MPKIEFTDRFNWTVRDRPRVVRVYRKGMVEVVTQECADAVLHAKKGKLVSPAEMKAKTSAPEEKVNKKG